MSGSGEWVRWLQLSVYVPVLVAGVPLNLATLWKLWSIRRWRESTVYLLNLVISDTLLLFSLPFKIHAYERRWELGRTFCSLLESLVYVNVYGSILLCVCIAADRYVSLRFAFAARRHLCSPLKASLLCLLIWVLVFSCSYLVYGLHLPSSGNPNGTSNHCFQNFSNHTWENSGIVVAMETVFCSSAVAMVFFSVQVVRVLQELRRKNPDDPKLRNNKSMKIVLSNLLVFLVCFIPYHVATLLYFTYKTQGVWQGAGPSLRNFVHSSLCLSSVNCLADGACYYFILKENLHTTKLERHATINTVHTQDELRRTFTHTLGGETPEDNGGAQGLKDGSTLLHRGERIVENFRDFWSKKQNYSFTRSQAAQ